MLRIDHTSERQLLEDLYWAAQNLRDAQRKYMLVRADPNVDSDIKEMRGRVVGQAAENLDGVLQRACRRS